MENIILNVNKCDVIAEKLSKWLNKQINEVMCLAVNEHKYFYMGLSLS